MPNDLQRRYSDLLERERAALLDANFEELKLLVTEKEAMNAAILEGIGALSDEIRRRAERNQQLLRAAMAGLKNGSSFLSDPQVDTLRTYGSDGKMREPTSRSSFEIKA